MGKAGFRFEDPFHKDTELEYLHIGFTKQITWFYQDFLLATVLILIISLQLNRYYGSKRLAWSKSLRMYLLSDSPIWNGYFNSNMNLWIIVSYYVVNLAVSVINLPMDDSFNLALRFGLVAMSNIPLLYLLPLKVSVFSLALSYENLIIYHKAIGVLVLITSLIHAGAFMYCLNWTYLFTKSVTLTGFYMIGCYLLIGVSSVVFVRRYVYEFFYMLHILASYSFLPVCYRHHYVCKPFVVLVTVSLIIDKLMKVSKTYVTDCRVISSESNPNYLIIKVLKPLKFDWKCSSHLFINIPRLSLLQTHPFTISNLPDSSNEVLLIVRVNNGFTKRLYERSLVQKEFKCLIHGPYGISHTHIHIDQEDAIANRYSISEESGIQETLNDSNPSNPPFLQIRENDKLSDDKKTMRVSYGSINSSLSSSSFSIEDHVKNVFDSYGVVTNDSKEKYLLISAGSGITFVLPILLKLLEYEKKWRVRLDFKFIWILSDDSILELFPSEIRNVLETPKRRSNFIQSQTNEDEDTYARVNLWFTSKQGRPNLEELLYFSTNNGNVSHLKVYGCGPGEFINGVKKFGIDQVSGDCEVDLILEQFSF